MPALTLELFSAVQDSMDALRSEVSDVRYAPMGDDDFDGILFSLRGDEYRAELTGRNAGLTLALDGRESDRSVAVRCILDGTAVKVEGSR